MRRAAIRRANFELGINDLTIDDLHVGSRILYYADACDTFAEFELDYIIFSKKDIDVSNFNKDEVMAVEYVGINEIDDFIKERK
jgi:isopentenyldiphosphate isomerase